MPLIPDLKIPPQVNSIADLVLLTLNITLFFYFVI